MWQFLYIFRMASILAKHDAMFFFEYLSVSPVILKAAAFMFGRKVNLRRGQRLANALEEMGPTYIKFGQALSVRPDLVGDDIAEDLSGLQDKLPPFPSDEAKQIIEEELGKPLDELFATFDDTPVAAASIAQVHFAEDKAGNKLAVKVLRPNVEKNFKEDIDFLYFVAGLVNRAVPKFRRLKLREVVDNFARTVSVEMDLRMEAAAASELKQNMADEEDVYVPSVYWDYTSQRVMVLERVEGIHIDDKEQLIAAGHDVNVLIERASRMFFKQVYRDGFFHADMHPGNLFIGEHGQIIILDFGIMGRLDERTRVYLAEMLLGFLEGNYRRVAEIHFEAGYIPKDQDLELFSQACRAIGEPVMGKPQDEISVANLLAQLFKVSEEFQMETQPQLILLQKTMMLAEGLGRKLNPHVNFWEMSRPLIREWGKEHLGPRGKAKSLFEDVEYAIRKLRHLPDVVTEEGIKLHPDTLRVVIKEQQAEKGWQAWAWSAMVAILATLVTLSLFD